MAGKCALIGAPCPQTSDQNAKRFCPLWAEGGIVWQNDITGQERVEHCGARMMVPGMIEVIKASNRPAAAVESTRNEIVAGFDRVSKAVALSGAARRKRLAMNQDNEL
jgi:hypothetical protein